MKRALIRKNWLGSIMFSVLFMIFTSVMAYAGEGRFVFSDLTATDKVTGLMWTRNANLTGKGASADKLVRGRIGKKDWKEAHNFIEQLNKEKYARYADWRLPSDKELATLIEYMKSLGIIKDCSAHLEKLGFYDVQADGFYWSSTTVIGDSGKSKVARMDYCSSGGHHFKNGKALIWPVRGGK